jgi:hypothetical protein
MLSPKYAIACLVLILLGSSGLAEGAPKTYPAAACRPGLDGPCVPKRVTYGYTPTNWRRWPTDQAANAPKAEPESLPTPAKEARPSEEPEGPILAPEEPPQTPAESEPATPKPDVAPPFAPPFDDTPPAPPKELPPPTEELLPDAPPELPADRQSPLDSAAPPSPPEDDSSKDDPFKDDPPTTETNHGASRNRLRNVEGQPAAISWHSTAKKPTTLALGSQPRAVSLNEPRRLQVTVNDADGQGAAQPISVPARINPLRPAERQTREVDVIPTASWSAQESSSNPEAAPLRRNPLRSN